MNLAVCFRRAKGHQITACVVEAAIMNVSIFTYYRSSDSDIRWRFQTSSREHTRHERGRWLPAKPSSRLLLALSEENDETDGKDSYKSRQGVGLGLYSLLILSQNHEWAARTLLL